VVRTIDYTGVSAGSEPHHVIKADELPRCQHCPAPADERSFMCEDHSGEADEEVQTLRDQLAAAENVLEAIRKLGAVCDQYEICTHRACADSYAAWSLADGYLSAKRR
jgi:hypothetical protein